MKGISGNYFQKACTFHPHDPKRVDRVTWTWAGPRDPSNVKPTIPHIVSSILPFFSSFTGVASSALLSRAASRHRGRCTLQIFPAMAAMNRLLRSSSSSLSLARRCFSTAAASETVKSHPYIHTPLSTGQDPKAKSVQWVFLGCPGVGKGTYASRLSTLLGVPHIATGDLVREELNSSGPLSKQVR